jgi:opacity protein-like surface antigen
LRRQGRALASFTGRLGYALDRTLYYAKAGPAWGRSTFQLNFGAADAGQIVTTSVNRAGWTLGGGVEQAVTDKWSVVGEYRYVDLGSAKVSFSGVPDSISTDGPVAINQRYHMLMLGMNYRLY